MKYALLVAQREYGENARTKGFWIGLALFPLILWASIKVPALLEGKKPIRYYAVADFTKDLGAIVDRAVADEFEQRRSLQLFAQMETQRAAGKQALEEQGAGASYTPPALEAPRVRFQRVELPAQLDQSSAERVVESAKPYLLGEQQLELDGEPVELFALFVLPEGTGAEHRPAKPEYWSINQTDTGLKELVEDALDQELRQRAFLVSGVAASEVQRIAKITARLEAKDPKKEAGKETVSMADKIRQWSPIGLVYLLFVAIMTVSQMLLNNCVEEKSNRIIEVLLSSVTPLELMLGKLIGIAGIGFTMLFAWLSLGFGVLKLSSGSESELVGTLIHVLGQPLLITSFLVYFTLGYLLYASLFLAVGSMCNTIKDAQNYMGPIMTVMITPLITMVFIAQDPNGILARVLSWVPLFTPFVMLNRVAADPPLFDVFGTGALLLVSVMFALWLSARIFRTGILRTGQPPKILELLRWATRPRE